MPDFDEAIAREVADRILNQVPADSLDWWLLRKPEDAEHARLIKSICGKPMRKNETFYCTRKQGHIGRHVATDMRNKFICSMSNHDEAPNQGTT